MKKLLMLLVLISGLVFPWACSDNNTPSKPNTSFNTATPIPTGTQTPNSPTFTPTLAAGAPTFTPTNTFLPTPAFQHNYGTTGGPTGAVVSGTVLSVSEYEVKTAGSVVAVEGFNIGAGGSLGPPSVGNSVFQGFPTPGSTPPWQPVVVGLNGPQGFVNPGGGGGYSSILDVSGSGAVLYWGSATSPAPGAGYNGWVDYGLGFLWVPYTTNGYNLVSFNNPKGMTADSNGNVYVADTGNGRIELFNGTTGLHYWDGGAAPSTIITTAPATFYAFPFKQPYAVTADTASPANIWVGDNGYSPAYVEEFSSGGTTISMAWPTISGCVIHGLAVNPTSGNIYIADSGNNVVEVFSPQGVLLTEMTNPTPSAHELSPFSPSCIAFDSNGYAYVGDRGNDFIDVFK